MPRAEPLVQIDKTALSLRMAIAADDFDAAATLLESFQTEFQAAWEQQPEGREAFLRSSLDGILGSLRLSFERRELVRRQLELISACEGSESGPDRKSSLSVSF